MQETQNQSEIKNILPDNHSRSKRKQTILDMVLIALFAAIIAVCAQITIPVPPVPFTLQTLAVFLAGGLLGMKRGFFSVLIYILLGAVGVPVFAGFKGGFAALIGPTGGYIIGFIATVLIVGFFYDKFGSKLWITAVAMLVGLLACYVFGTAWFLIVYNQTKGGMDLLKALSLCVTPFLLFDAVKIAVAAILCNRLHKLIKI